MNMLVYNIIKHKKKSKKFIFVKAATHKITFFLKDELNLVKLL